MKGEWMLILPVLLPILGGAIIPLIRPLSNRRYNAIYTNIIVCITTMLFGFLLTLGNTTLRLFQITDSLGFFFKLDNMGKIFAIITIGLWLISTFFSDEYLKHEENTARYQCFFLLSLGSLMGICFSGNLITMYLFYEIMTLTTLPLVLHSLTKEAVDAGVKFLFYSIGGAFCALLGFFYLNKFCTSFEFIPGGTLNRAALSGNEASLLVIIFLMIIGFGSKAGMLPLHAWLPKAHPVAPAPISALLSGNVTKMGVLAIIRLIFYVVGADFIRGTWVQYAFMGITLVTIFMGSMLAYKEAILKKRLAYSTISQVSYILFGISLLNATGVVGALLHVVFHAIIKNVLFLVAGAIIYKTGKTRVSELSGIGKEMPITMWCYTIASLGLIGIPPTSAFLSKWYLANGALESNIKVFSWLGPVVLLASALLTAGYLFTITMKGFFPGAAEYKKAIPSNEPSKCMTLPLLLLAALTVLFGMFPNYLLSFVTNLVESIL